MLAGLNTRFSNFTPNTHSSGEEQQETYEVCLANISPLERRKRLRFGIIQLVITLVILAALLVTGADKLWRLPLFFMFAAAATGFYQWRDKT